MTDLLVQYQCVLCRAIVPADDANAPKPNGRCICRTCYARQSAEPPAKINRLIAADLESAMENFQ